MRKVNGYKFISFSSCLLSPPTDTHYSAVLSLSLPRLFTCSPSKYLPVSVTRSNSLSLLPIISLFWPPLITSLRLSLCTCPSPITIPWALRKHPQTVARTFLCLILRQAFSFWQKLTIVKYPITDNIDIPTVFITVLKKCVEVFVYLKVQL